MILLLSILLTTLCTEKEHKELQDKIETARKEYTADCEAFEAELKNIPNAICNNTATADQKQQVFNVFNDVFKNARARFDSDLDKYEEFSSTLAKDLQEAVPGELSKVKKDFEMKFDNFVKSIHFTELDISLKLAYRDNLKDSPFLIEDESVEDGLEQPNKMFHQIYVKYSKIAVMYKQLVKISLEMGGKKSGEKVKDKDDKDEKVKDEKKDGDKKEGLSNLTIILMVVCVVGGVIVISLLLYFFISKKRQTE